jgi:hypothetical protein
MATQIREELSIVTSDTSDGFSGNASPASGLTVTSGAIVQLDTAQYNGTVTYYFEALCKNTDVTNAATLKLRRKGTTTDDATLTFAANAADYVLMRSAAISPPAGATEYVTFGTAGAGGALRVRAARIIVIQNASSLTSVETQIEIGSEQSFTATTLTALTNPKYWKYTSANWDGAITAYWETTMTSNSTKITATAELQVADGTGDGFTGWSAVSLVDSGNADLTTTSSTPARVRSAPISLIAGRNYRVVYKTSNSKSAINVYNAKIIIDQSATSYTQQILQANDDAVFFSVQGGTGSSGETSQAVGQSINPGTYSIGKIRLFMKKVGSPTDNVQIEILSGSMTGTVLGTSSAVAGSSLSTTTGWIDFLFSTSVSVTSGTKYYLRITRTGARSTTNYYQISSSTAGSLSSAGTYVEDNSAWGTEAASDLVFQVYSVSTVTVSMLEPQYLLANGLIDAGTALQTFLTKWDSTEWSGVTNTYKHAVDAANGSTSVVELDTAGGTQVTGSSVSSPDNQGISGSLTMPADGNLTMKATTNNGDVYASRILVLVTPAVAAAFVASRALTVLQAINRSNTY